MQGPTIKITPNLLFEYQCTSGKFIRLPNRIESNRNFFRPNWNALLSTGGATERAERCHEPQTNPCTTAAGTIPRPVRHESARTFAPRDACLPRVSLGGACNFDRMGRGLHFIYI